MVRLKITSIGSSAGLILPKEAMKMLNAEKGDSLFLTQGQDGSCRLTAYDPEFERQAAVAKRVMREDRDILRALAK